MPNSSFIAELLKKTQLIAGKMATKTTLVNVLLGSSGTGSGTLQNRYCGGFLNPSNGLTVNAPVRDCTQPVSFPGFMMNSVSQQHFAKKPVYLWHFYQSSLRLRL